MNKKPELDNQEARTNIDEGAKAASTSSRGLGSKKLGDRTPKTTTPEVATPPTEHDDRRQPKPEGSQVNTQNSSNSSATAPSTPPQSMIWVLPVLLLVIATSGGGFYLYLQNQQQQSVKPTPTDSPSGTSSIRIIELSADELNGLNKSGLESRFKKIEAELNKLQQSKKNPSNDSQRIAEIDRAISAYENQKIEINRAIANINAANIDDKDKLQQIKNSLIAYDNIEKLKSIDCNQKTQVTKVFDDAIARLKRFAPSSPIYTEAQDLTNNYTKIRSDFPNQCKKAQTSPATTTPVNPTDTSVDTPPIQGAPPQPPVNEVVRDLPPDVTVKNSEKIAPQSQQFQNDDVPDLPSDVKVRESGKITP